MRHQPTFLRRCSARCHSLSDTVQDWQDRQNQRPLEVELEPEAVVYNTTLHVLQYRALLHCFTLFFLLSLVSSLPSHPILPLSDMQHLLHPLKKTFRRVSLYLSQRELNNPPPQAELVEELEIDHSPQEWDPRLSWIECDPRIHWVDNPRLL